MKKEENVIIVVKKLFANEGIRVTKQTITDYLLSDPDYPSLLSICNVLKCWNIDYDAIRLDSKSLRKINKCFIAHLDHKFGKIVLITRVTRSKVYYYDSSWPLKSMTLKSFFELWNGVVIILMPTKNSGELNFWVKKHNQIIEDSIQIGFFFANALILFFFIVKNISIQRNYFRECFFICLLHFLGLVISTLLLAHKTNTWSGITRQICSIHSKLNCDNLLADNASYVFGWISWADIGVIYFLGGSASFLLCPGHNIFPVQFILTICAMSFTIYSFVYQFIVIKHTCPLCLAVQIVLIAELLYFILSEINFVINSQAVFHTLSIYIYFALVYLIIRQFKVYRGNITSSRQILNKLKYNQDVFSNLLLKSKIIDEAVIEKGFFFGKRNAALHITAFVSLACSSCTSIITDLFQLVKRGDNISINLIFKYSKDSAGAKDIENLTRYYQILSNHEFIEYYGNRFLKNGNRFHMKIKDLNKFDSDDTIIKTLTDFERLYEDYTIIKTPTIFINKYELPDLYTVTDIIKLHNSTLCRLENNKLRWCMPKNQ